MRQTRKMRRLTREVEVVESQAQSQVQLLVQELAKKYGTIATPRPYTS